MKVFAHTISLRKAIGWPMNKSTAKQMCYTGRTALEAQSKPLERDPKSSRTDRNDAGELEFKVRRTAEIPMDCKFVANFVESALKFASSWTS